MMEREIDTGRVKRSYSVENPLGGLYVYSTSSGRYNVNVDDLTCNCPSRRRPCKHLVDAFALWLEV
jgi:hypothetical protein